MARAASVWVTDLPRRSPADGRHASSMLPALARPAGPDAAPRTEDGVGLPRQGPHHSRSFSSEAANRVR